MAMIGRRPRELARYSKLSSCTGVERPDGDARRTGLQRQEPKHRIRRLGAVDNTYATPRLLTDKVWQFVTARKRAPKLVSGGSFTERRLRLDVAGYSKGSNLSRPPLVRSSGRMRLSRWPPASRVRNAATPPSYRSCRDSRDPNSATGQRSGSPSVIQYSSSPLSLRPEGRTPPGSGNGGSGYRSGNFARLSAYPSS